MAEFKHEPHDFLHSKILGKKFCGKCGLVALNNRISDWCVGKGCDHADHPEYAKVIKRYTKTLGQD